VCGKKDTVKTFKSGQKYQERSEKVWENRKYQEKSEKVWEKLGTLTAFPFFLFFSKFSQHFFHNFP